MDALIYGSWVSSMVVGSGYRAGLSITCLLPPLELVVVDGRPYEVAALRDAHERRLERIHRLGARLRIGITLRLASAFFALGR